MVVKQQTEEWQRPEHFRLLAGLWDIQKAKELVKDREPDGTVSPNNLDAWGDAIYIDKEYAMTVDLSRPLIVAHIAGDYLLIDGWHRMYRARQEGVEQLKAHLLSEDDEAKVRIR
jgi:hypothetical protein